MLFRPQRSKTQFFLICGSRASRNPSPTKFKEKSINAIVTPGKISCHGKIPRFWIPSAARLPHDAYGGCTPNPRNERNASWSITAGNHNGGEKKTRPKNLGTKNRKKIFAPREPLSPTAKNKSPFFSDTPSAHPRSAKVDP